MCDPGCGVGVGAGVGEGVAKRRRRRWWLSAQAVARISRGEVGVVAGEVGERRNARIAPLSTSAGGGSRGRSHHLSSQEGARGPPVGPCQDMPIPLPLGDVFPSAVLSPTPVSTRMSSIALGLARRACVAISRRTCAVTCAVDIHRLVVPGRGVAVTGVVRDGVERVPPVNANNPVRTPLVDRRVEGAVR